MTTRLDRLAEMVAATQPPDDGAYSWNYAARRGTVHRLLRKVAPELIKVAQGVKGLRRAHAAGVGWATARNAMADADEALDAKLVELFK